MDDEGMNWGKRETTKGKRNDRRTREGTAKDGKNRRATGTGVGRMKGRQRMARQRGRKTMGKITDEGMAGRNDRGTGERKHVRKPGYEKSKDEKARKWKG